MAVAYAEPHQAESSDRLGLHDPHHALGLEGLGPVGVGRGVLAEEEEVQDVDVEVWGDGVDDVSELPHCVDAEAVEEEEVGFGGC
ncbi:hypothetical protein M0R45_027553 [Rubus argutus]|uniref:Uncharacterized protein n=1 Tax=Rubus argutus TaxID=59490 RepID=A0AAW1X2I9_RUBAR